MNILHIVFRYRNILTIADKFPNLLSNLLSPTITKNDIDRHVLHFVVDDNGH